MRKSKRNSPIWELPSEEFKKLIANSQTISEVFKQFNLTNKGGNYRTLRLRLEEENVNITHFRKSIPSVIKGIIPLEDILVENSPYNRSSLRKRLIKLKIIPYVCQSCNLGSKWNESDLSLQLDHKNGISNDHRLDNLQFLCPNCHSQTSSFAGRNKRYHIKYGSDGPERMLKIAEKHCLKCNRKILPKSIHCRKCSGKIFRPNKLKINWPSLSELLDMVNKSNFRQAGLKLGVSDNAVRKRIRRLQALENSSE